MFSKLANVIEISCVPYVGRVCHKSGHTLCYLCTDTSARCVERDEPPLCNMEGIRRGGGIG